MKPASTRHQPPFSRSREASTIGVRALAAVLLLAVAAPVVAGTVSCSVSATGVSFGSYDVFAAGAITSTTTLSVTCTLTAGGATTVNYVVALAPGSSGTFVQRQMKNGGNALGYNLYSDSARTTVWGDGTGSTQTVSGSMRVKPSTPSLTDNFTGYGSVPALQDAAVGAYSDNITITVTY